MTMAARKSEFGDDGLSPLDDDFVNDEAIEDDDEPVTPAKQAKPEDDDDFEVEIVDATPEEDRGRQPPEGVEELDSEEHRQEIEALNNEKIKQRFAQYTYRANEERRRADRLEREMQAAAEIAQRWQQENAMLRRSMVEAGTQQAVARREQIDAEIASTRTLIQKAVDEGDGAGLAAAQERMGMLTAEKTAIMSRPRPPQPQQRQQPQQPQPQPRQPQPQVHPNTSAWVEKNKWFGAPGSERMTAFAKSIDAELINRGMTPDDPQYFREIDTALRETFPKNFVRKNGKTPPVAGARRSDNPAGGGKITLTSDEVALAKRMGVTVKDYAKEKARLQKAGEI
jgi:hypothetical protein